MVVPRDNVRFEVSLQRVELSLQECCESFSLQEPREDVDKFVVASIPWTPSSGTNLTDVAESF